MTYGDGLADSTHDGWTLLGALAVLTRRARIGAAMTYAFSHPGTTASPPPTASGIGWKRRTKNFGEVTGRCGRLRPPTLWAARFRSRGTDTDDLSTFRKLNAPSRTSRLQCGSSARRASSSLDRRSATRGHLRAYPTIGSRRDRLERPASQRGTQVQALLMRE